MKKIYSLAATLLFLLATATTVTAGDYSRGTFFINEDWGGHNSSTLNFLSDDGTWTYRVVQTENPGTELGSTADFGTIYGGRFYIMCKQPKDGGSTITGGRLTVCDAKTMKVIKQFADISGGDGRAFLGVTPEKGYIGTSTGITILDIDNMELNGRIANISGNIGNMIRVNDRVFAVNTSTGQLLVINADSDEVEQTVASPNGLKFFSVVLAKDGSLWLSMFSGSKAANSIARVDPNTLETTVTDCPEGIYGPANSSFAWMPDGFCASKQNNVLYWNGGASSWTAGSLVFRYDIDKGEFSKYLDFTNDTDKFSIYGSSLRIDPVSDNAYMTLFKGYGDQTYIVREFDNNGTLVNQYDMEKNYWFAGIPIFPDNEMPVTNEPAPVVATTDMTLPLNDIATDADNMDAAIIKTIKSISDDNILAAEIRNGELIITPKAQGNAIITIGINSNGMTAEANISVSVPEEFTGINDTDAVAGGYDNINISIDGKQTAGGVNGIRFVRLKNGAVIKVLK